MFRACHRPKVYFLREQPGAEWIQYRPPYSLATRKNESYAFTAVFARDFELDQPGAGATLRIRAMRNYRVQCNGLDVEPTVVTPAWKIEDTVALDGYLQAGTNRLRVTVSCQRGPPSLWIAASGLPPEVSTGSGWSVVAMGALAPAPLARERFPQPLDDEGAGPLPSLEREAPLILTVFFLSVLAFAFRSRIESVSASLLPKAMLDRCSAPNLVAAVAAVAWCVLFVNNASAMEELRGPDFKAHIAYLDWLLEEGTLPLASDGWSMYNPPLFYVLSAAVHALTGGAAFALKLLPFLAGLGQIALARWIGRSAFGTRPTAQVAVVAFAALIPMNVYVAQFFTNEGCAGFLIGLTLCMAFLLTKNEDSSVKAYALLGLFTGLALLTKFSALVAAGSIFFVLACRIRRNSGPKIRALWRLLAFVAVAGAVCGWVYIRNLRNLGTAFPGNWVGRYWQDPGFHTGDYFLSFGAWLTNPFKVGLNSFFDSIYATFWSDAMLSGAASVEGGLSWNRDAMSAVLLLATPAMILGGLGLIRAIGRVVLHGDLAWALVLLCGVGFTALIAYASVHHPYYSVTKAFYGLGGLVPLCLLFADGFHVVDELAQRRAAFLRPALYGWICVLAACVFKAYLI